MEWTEWTSTGPNDSCRAVDAAGLPVGWGGVFGVMEKIGGGLAHNSLDELIDKIIETDREHILDSYEISLAGAGTAVSGRSPFALQSRGRAAAVLDEVRRRLQQPAAGEPPLTSRPGGPGATVRARARRVSHPSESLREADLLCQAILSGVVASLPPHPDLGPAVVRLAVTTHRVIMEDLAGTATSYLGYLVERLHRSHADERRRVARELHDLVAHSVALARQNLELFVLYRDRDPGGASARLDSTFRQMHEATDMVRALAQDLRRSGAEDGLRCALMSYVGSFPDGPRIEVRFDGDEAHIPEAIRGELFLVLREGIRNARAHARAGCVRLDVEIGARRVRAGVVDDGVGFDEATVADGTGLASMRERVTLMGGTIVVSSAPGRGAAVCVEVPLVGACDG
jgi:signal transduction histidine kinase